MKPAAAAKDTHDFTALYLNLTSAVSVIKQFLMSFVYVSVRPSVCLQRHTYSCFIIPGSVIEKLFHKSRC